MGTIKIINHSTLADYAAIMRVGSFMAGEEQFATYSEGIPIIKINKSSNNTYVLTDIENN